MSQYTTGVNFNSNSGFFEVSSVDSSGKVSTQSLSFSSLCMMFSLDSLNAQDEVFATQFAAAEEQVSQLTMINDCMQMLNKYSIQFENDDDATIHLDGYIDPNNLVYPYISGPIDPTTNANQPYSPDTDMDLWLTVYYPGLVESGLVESPISMDGAFTKSELDTLMENLQSAQSTVSSQNEQQMLLTNDAANKRSTILQQAQTLLQAAQDARNAAAKT